MHQDHTEEVEKYLREERLTAEAPELLSLVLEMLRILEQLNVLVSSGSSERAQQRAKQVVNRIEKRG